MPQRRCATVLLVNESDDFLTVAADALRVEGIAVLLVPAFDRAVAAMRAGFRPDAILVDLGNPLRFAAFLRLLFEEPSWRDLPVLGTSDAGIFQIAPSSRQRNLPAPSTPGLLAAALDSICSERERLADGALPP